MPPHEMPSLTQTQTEEFPSVMRSAKSSTTPNPATPQPPPPPAPHPRPLLSGPHGPILQRASRVSGQQDSIRPIGLQQIKRAPPLRVITIIKTSAPPRRLKTTIIPNRNRPSASPGPVPRAIKQVVCKRTAQRRLRVSAASCRLCMRVRVSL